MYWIHYFSVFQKFHSSYEQNCGIVHPSKTVKVEERQESMLGDNAFFVGRD